MVQNARACSPSKEESLVYEAADLYELAFSYRDYAAECDALLDFAKAAQNRRSPTRVLELGAGPALHAIELARRGLAATALDLSPSMCFLAEKRARESGLKIHTHCGDMIDFEIDGQFDLALLMINSIAHVYTLDSLVRHFSTVGRHLAPGGVYVLEVMHPGDFVGRGARPRGVGEPWTVRRGELELSVRWGRPNDPYDPLTQVFEANVELVAREHGREQRLAEKVPMRDWTKGEIEAALALSGELQIADLYGDFDVEAPLRRDSWRMIIVLEKRPKHEYRAAEVVTV